MATGKRTAPETVTLFDPRDAERQRTVLKANAERWKKQGWVTSPPEPKADDKS